MQLFLVSSNNLPLINRGARPSTTKYAQLVEAVGNLKEGYAIRIPLNSRATAEIQVSRISGILRRTFGRLSELKLSVRRAVNGDTYVIKY